MKKLVSIIFLSFVILLSLFLPGFFQDNTLVLGGSTSVYTLFHDLESITKNSEMKYYYNSMGSFAAIKRVQDETFIAGFMSKSAPKDLSSQITRFSLATDGIIFLYHLPLGCKNKDSSQTSINFNNDELQKVFLAKNPDWSFFSNVSCTRKVNIYRINRENGSGTRISFEQEIMSKKSKYYEESVMKHSSLILKMIAKTEGSLAYVSFAYRKKVEVLKKKNKQINIAFYRGVKATRDNIKDGSYKFSRPFVGLYLTKNKNKLRPFSKFLQRDDTKKRFKKLGFIYNFKW